MRRVKRTDKDLEGIEKYLHSATPESLDAIINELDKLIEKLKEQVKQEEENKVMKDVSFKK